MSGTTEQSGGKNSRVVILRMIRDHKHILFGPFSDRVTKLDKEKSWQDIANHSHTLGIYPEYRSGSYLRDTTWQNWRKRFVEKREKKYEYEKAGGSRKIEFDEADLILAEILEGREDYPRSGRERSFSTNNSAGGSGFEHFLEVDFKEEPDQYQGPGQEDTEPLYRYPDGAIHPSNSDCEEDQGSSSLDEEGSLDGIQTRGTQPGQEASYGSYGGEDSTGIDGVTLRRGVKRPRSATESKDDGHMNNLKEKKLRLELELLQLEKYKRKLEIFKLEKDLGLPPSQITKKLATVSGTYSCN